MMGYKLIFVFLGQNRFPDILHVEVERINRIINVPFEIWYQFDAGELSHSQRLSLQSSHVKLREMIPATDDELIKFDPKLRERNSSALRAMGGGLRRATIWRQIIDLRKFLDCLQVDDELKTIIVRLRPDYTLSDNFYLRLNENIFSLNPCVVGGKLLTRKIWVMWASNTVPFYFHDAVFAGTLGDLKLLVDEDCNRSLSAFYPSASLPIFFFMKPFISNVDLQYILRILKTRGFDYDLLTDQRYLSGMRYYYLQRELYFNVQYFKSFWYLQWLNGASKKRIWYVFRSRLQFLILPYLLSIKRLSPFAVESNCTQDNAMKYLKTLPRKKILLPKYIENKITKLLRKIK
jgi:hypothetical protein